MKELILKVTEEAGITNEQAKKAIESIKDYVVEKFPLLEAVVNNMFNLSLSN
jgi:nucleoid DNA-binding protein